MNGRILTVGARKGGVGKTALAREFGARLARDGQRVALVNADSQDTLTMTLGMKAEPGLSRILLTDDPAGAWLRPVPRKAWADIGTPGDLFVLPGDESTAAAGVQLILRKVPLFVLRDKLLDLLAGGQVDTIVIDTSPSIMPFAPWMYAAASAAVIPTGGALEGINGILQTEAGLKVIGQVTDGQHEIEVIGIVPTQILGRTNLHRKNWTAMKRQWHGKIWPLIEYRVTWQYAAQYGQVLSVYAPGSPADLEMEKVYHVLRSMMPDTEEVHA